MDKNDREMLCVAVPVVDYWQMRDDLDRLEGCLERQSEQIDRLEKVVHTLINHYHQERVKDWELVLREMLKDMDRKNGDKTRIRTG